MEPNYLIMLDYCTGQIIKIKLTEEEISKSETYEDFEDFMRTELEDKYEFRTKDVCWMTAENLEERTYNLYKRKENIMPNWASTTYVMKAEPVCKKRPISVQ